MITHVYQFALRRADNNKKQFIIERDLIYADHKLTREQIEDISVKYYCDVQITYLGQLTPTKKEEIINVEYHTKEMIEENIFNWNKEKENDQPSI